MNTIGIFLVLGIICGLGAAAVIITIITKTAEKKSGKPAAKYDERQQLARGKAYKSAFFTLMGYLLVYGSFDVITEIKWCDTFTGAFIGIILAIIVFVISCIMNDAYFSVTENPKSYIILFVVVFIADAFAGISAIADGSLIEDGLLTVRFMNILVALLSIAVLGAILIKLQQDRRESDTE